MAPSHAARDRETSYVKSTCPGVSMRFSSYCTPSAARDAARSRDEPIGQGRLPVVDVGHDAEVADVLRFHRRERLVPPDDALIALRIPPRTLGAVRDVESQVEHELDDPRLLLGIDLVHFVTRTVIVVVGAV